MPGRIIAKVDVDSLRRKRQLVVVFNFGRDLTPMIPTVKVSLVQGEKLIAKSQFAFPLFVVVLKAIQAPEAMIPSAVRLRIRRQTRLGQVQLVLQRFIQGYTIVLASNSYTGCIFSAPQYSTGRLIKRYRVFPRLWIQIVSKQIQGVSLNDTGCFLTTQDTECLNAKFTFKIQGVSLQQGRSYTGRFFFRYRVYQSSPSKYRVRQC